MDCIMFGLVALITMGTAARATDTDAPATTTTKTLATGPVFGGNNQGVAVCYLYNNGPSSITVTNTKFIQQPNVSVTITGNNCCSGSPCSGILAAGNICVFGANITNSSATLCAATVTGAVGQVRGEMDIRVPDTNTVLQVEELR